MKTKSKLIYSILLSSMLLSFSVLGRSTHGTLFSSSDPFVKSVNQVASSITIVIEPDFKEDTENLIGFGVANVTAFSVNIAAEPTNVTLLVFSVYIWNASFEGGVLIGFLQNETTEFGAFVDDVEPLQQISISYDFVESTILFDGYPGNLTITSEPILVSDIEFGMDYSLDGMEEETPENITALMDTMEHTLLLLAVNGISLDIPDEAGFWDELTERIQNIEYMDILSLAFLLVLVILVSYSVSASAAGGKSAYSAKKVTSAKF